MQGLEILEQGSGTEQHNHDLGYCNYNHAHKSLAVPLDRNCHEVGKSLSSDFKHQTQKRKPSGIPALSILFLGVFNFWGVVSLRGPETSEASDLS